MPTKNITFPELIQQFGSEDACHQALKELRWPDGVACPRCVKADRRADRISRVRKRRVFHCDECGYQFSVRVGTIFEDSHLPLWKWFLAIYMMVQSKKGISAKQLQRMLGGSYKTAWYLCHRIRKAMADEDALPLTGIVEADETFVGGKVRMRKGGPEAMDNKSVVMGAVQRSGGVRLGVVPNRRSKSVHGFVDEHVSRDAEALYSDELGVYKSAAKRRGLPHGRVNHGREEWVHGQVHTNTIEGVFSLLDRSILGAYHKVSKKHLPAYLHEVEWRYNNRSNPYLFRDTLLELIACERMEYKNLTG